MKSKKNEAVKPSYSRIKDDVADSLFVEIVKKIGAEKLYRKPEYSAHQLAKDLGTNPRYVSVVIALHTGSNYNALVNGYRLRDACRMLRSSRYKRYSIEEIGLMCGFSSRQAFYMAFHRERHETPRQYRIKNAGKTEAEANHAEEE